MTFTQVFGGTTIYPAGVSYRAIPLSVDQILSWPTEIATNTDVVAQIMDVTPSVASRSIFMPAADKASVGETALFFNAGSFAFIVKDTGGNTIVSIAPGLSYQVYLIGNATPNGSWRSTQYSAGTSSATAGSLVGAGIKAIGTTLNQSMSVTSLNANFAIGVNDRSAAFLWTGGAGTLTLPSAPVVGSDWFCHVRNSGTGAINITPVGGENINGAPTLPFNPGDSAIIISDGAGFFTVGFGQAPEFLFDYVSIDLSPPVTSPYVLGGANLNRIAYSFGGALTASMVVEVPATIQQYWISNDTTGLAAYTLTVKVAGQPGVLIARGSRAICYCNGTDVVIADTSSVAFPVTIAQGGTEATTASAARINLGGTSVGIAVFTALTQADARIAIGAGQGSVTSVSGTGTVSGISLGGTVTSTGNLTLTGPLDLSSPPAIGGTAPAAGTFTTLLPAAMRETRVATVANNLNLLNGNYFTHTVSGATTFTVSNVPTSGTAVSLIFDITNGGSAVITWWSNVKWGGGTAPTLTASGRDILGFYTYDNGTTWNGLVLGKDMK
jgi:hypothetical protein